MAGPRDPGVTFFCFFNFPWIWLDQQIYVNLVSYFELPVSEKNPAV